MELKSRIIATAAVVVFLVSAFSLRAEEAAKPSTGASSDNAADSGSTATAALPSAPMETDLPYPSRRNFGTPKAELFLGYSHLRSVPTLADGNRLEWLHGGSTSIAFNFNRYLGLVGDFGGFNDSRLRLSGTNGNPPSVVDSSGTVFTYLAGPRLSFRSSSRVTPFIQALFGGIHASEVILSDCTGSCALLPAQNSFALTAGGGLDIRFHRHFALRLIQAEYLMTRFDNPSTGGSASQNDIRLSSGIVFRFGGNAAPLPPPLPVAYSCSVNPSSVFPGEPVAALGAALNLDPARTPVYTWSADGGTVTGVSNTAKIDTTALAPGAYTLKCHVSEGDRPFEIADATAVYTVKAFEPPTVSCAATPASVLPGESSTITATAVSPQNRTLSYSYSSTSGTVSGSGSTATLSTAGASIGSVAVTCNVVDDKSQTATASTTVTVLAPPPPPEQVRLEARLALHSVFFPTAQPRAEHPEGGLVVSQQGTLATLATDFKTYLTFKPDAHLTLTGHADVRGSVEYNQALSERRVARTKQFLVEQGVPEARIETRGLGEEEELTASQVKELVEQNPDLSAAEREKVLHDLNVIVLAQNRRVDVTLSTTGQQSVRLYPFNAADSLTLLKEKSLAPRKKPAAAKK